MGVGVGVGVADGVGVGVGVAEAVLGATSSTWRNRSWAVVPTSCSTWFEVLPGTETLIRLVPSVVTDAPLKPAPLIRLFMIDCARARSLAIWADDVFVCDGVTAFRAIVVPLEMSRPRPTLNRLSQCDGWNREPPSTPISITTISAASVRSSRPGREVVDGGAKARLPLARSGPWGR